ncbi:MAG: hypothetical protein NTW67_01940 [Candidatus Woesearchaeota archaeon]|nr:hypothetical protein [Candidatus Woesearchaeota archaeon]
MNPTLQEIIKPLLNDEYRKKGITSKDKIRDILEDSLACTELLLNIDEQLHIFILDKDFDKIKTVGDLEVYIQKYQPAEKCASQ